MAAPCDPRALTEVGGSTSHQGPHWDSKGSTTAPARRPPCNRAMQLRRTRWSIWGSLMPEAFKQLKDSRSVCIWGGEGRRTESQQVVGTWVHPASPHVSPRLHVFPTKARRHQKWTLLRDPSVRLAFFKCPFWLASRALLH